MSLKSLKSAATLAVGVLFIALGYQFFTSSVKYLAAEPPRVTAGLMAGLAGFTFTAAAVTIIRDWIIAERIEDKGKQTTGKTA